MGFEQPAPPQGRWAGHEQATDRPGTHRLLVLSDFVHPFVYRESFPHGLPAVDLVLAAGDLPGYYLEFLATKLTVPVLYVPGNHENELMRDEHGGKHAPCGVLNVHRRVVEVAGLRIAGWGGVPRYRDGGSGQYGPLEAGWALRTLSWRLRREPLDVFLTHAPPLGPHAGTDFAHRGCDAITQFVHRHRPRLLVHGHIHEYEGRKTEYLDGPTRVVNAYGYQVLEL